MMYVFISVLGHGYGLTARLGTGVYGMDLYGCGKYIGSVWWLAIYYYQVRAGGIPESPQKAIVKRNDTDNDK